MTNNLKLVLTAIAGIAASCQTASGSLSTTNGPATHDPQKPRYIEGEIIVRFNENAADHHLVDALNRVAGNVKKHVQTHAMFAAGHPGLTKIATRMKVEQAIEALQHHPAIVSAEPNYRLAKLQSDPRANWVIKDKFYGHSEFPLWGMYGANTGLVPATTGAPANAYGSQADEAWALGFHGLLNPLPTPFPAVYVGVIDEGICWQHPELAGVVGNPNEAGALATDGIDNDDNGYTDDAYGWDFISEDNSVFDPVYRNPDIDAHGTHVAGTIGARANNSYAGVANIGVAGVSQGVGIISGKFLGPEDGTTLDAIQAIDYFTDLRYRGVNVVALNNSWGGGPYSAELHAAIIRAAKANILFIAAAGNGDIFGRAINIDASPTYPACYDTSKNAVSGSTVIEAAASYDSVISVAALQADGQKASFSNYGATSVDLAAPGHQIVSTYPWQDPSFSGNPYTWDPQNCYMPYNGTSMATPHVTGAVALYAAYWPEATPAAIKYSILTAARNTPTPSMAGKSVTGGRLNLLDVGNEPADPPVLPAAPTGLTAKAGTKGVISLVWGNVAGETGFELQRATNGAFTSGLSTIQKGADVLAHDDKGLKSKTTYYYRVRAKNAAGASGWSASVSLRAP